MKYPKVYALLRERMADDNDIPDTDEIIAAALDAARAEVASVAINNLWPEEPTDDALAAIDALRGTNG